ncbi:putative RDD family membrane protein YckC [Microbacterium halimionae]|uniref:Putative RDD family membrane protein YckC n=1 Tax=Microbacterium halimionae TaxID=1526413 RepID=A0A7W3PKX6_9MICO|nr:putative RDD family membrane protein YckC [Microbacterium halimionae]NII95639.1 putative RDD family membrane protein YckC [Microbacterium halimionae]
MLRKATRWIWLLIPVAVGAGIFLVAWSPDPASAALDLVWVAAVVGLLTYLSVSSRRKDRKDDEHPDA